MAQPGSQYDKPDIKNYLEAFYDPLYRLRSWLVRHGREPALEGTTWRVHQKPAIVLLCAKSCAQDTASRNQGNRK